ncbi:MAG: hypothetical protein HAW67_04915 [Endozoicomonadaceae bacterium]|nr:hypothetical protein [Endozoicomonadaceae bacterium]
MYLFENANLSTEAKVSWFILHALKDGDSKKAEQAFQFVNQTDSIKAHIALARVATHQSSYYEFALQMIGKASIDAIEAVDVNPSILSETLLIALSQSSVEACHQLVLLSGLDEYQSVIEVAINNFKVASKLLNVQQMCIPMLKKIVDSRTGVVWSLLYNRVDSHYYVIKYNNGNMAYLRSFTEDAYTAAIKFYCSKHEGGGDIFSFPVNGVTWKISGISSKSLKTLIAIYEPKRLDVISQLEECFQVHKNDVECGFSLNGDQVVAHFDNEDWAIEAWVNLGGGIELFLWDGYIILVNGTQNALYSLTEKINVILDEYSVHGDANE